MRAAVLVRLAFWSFLAGAAVAGCGGHKPVPVVPPGEVSCDEGCANIAKLPCGVDLYLCTQQCRVIAKNNPQYPTCLSRSESCDDANQGCQ